ncbi:hypothetical protein FKM82_028351 [Ascaphus truei]
MASGALMPEPLCLIENVRRKEFVVNQEAAQILSDITQPVVVVAIVGKYRTGKSYLMNKLAGRSDGFPLGCTIQSKTKGIWMWCVPHPSKPGHTLVLLDTEGLGDVEKGDSENDAWIFSLAVLLSSTLVYNSVGTIDQQAMEQLHYVTEISERIKVTSSQGAAREENETSEFKRFFPSFIWCVRDFTLILELDGNAVTEDEYLMNSLKKNADGERDHNLPQECILHYFHSHKCFVFEQPTSAKDLKHLENLLESQLEPMFVQQAHTFCDYVYKNSQPKTLPGGHTVDGRGLCHLAVTYIDAIRSGTIPCLENMVLALALIENSRALQEALSMYEAEMRCWEHSFPTETQDEFLNIHKLSEEEALRHFMGRSFKDDTHEYQDQLIRDLGEKMKGFSQRNDEASTNLCKALIWDKSEVLETMIGDGVYLEPGGHSLFLKDKQTMVDAYFATPDKGIKCYEVLQEFLKDKEGVEAAILQADQALTQSQKEMEEQRSQAEAAERDRQILQENNGRLEKLMEDEQRRYEQHEKMLREKLEEDSLRMIRENEWLIEQKLKAQQDLLSAGFNQRADALQREIQDLRNQRHSSSRSSGCVIS